MADSSTMAPAKLTMPNLPPLIMGGAGWSYQLISDPDAASVLDIVKAAFAQGIRAIDTSPYYEPSEELLGKAISHVDITGRHAREEFWIMTKCGRIAADHFDYSPSWIRSSVRRSLERFGTDYLDVVFCHDVEFVTIEDAVEAVGTLFDLVDEGLLRFAGISGYDLCAMVRVCEAVLERFDRPVDVVQNWAQLSLQNTRLESLGLTAFKKLGVKAVCNASPLACGLLRPDGVPVGKLGDWHPAPPELRIAAQDASEWVSSQDDSLASVALRFAISQATRATTSDFQVSTITGISKMSDLEENVETTSQILLCGESLIDKPAREDRKPSLLGRTYLNADKAAADQHLYDKVRAILGTYVDYDFMKPAESDTSASQIGSDRGEDEQDDMLSRL